MAGLYTGRAQLDSGVLNVRSEPGGSVIGAVKSGEEVQVLADLGEWVQIEHAGVTGFAAKRYICFVKGTQDTRLFVTDENGKTFLAEGDVTVKIVSGEID